MDALRDNRRLSREYDDGTLEARQAFVGISPIYQGKAQSPFFFDANIGTEDLRALKGSKNWIMPFIKMEFSFRKKAYLLMKPFPSIFLKRTTGE